MSMSLLPKNDLIFSHCAAVVQLTLWSPSHILVPPTSKIGSTLLVRFCLFECYLRHWARACDLYICSQMSGPLPTNINDPDWARLTPWSSRHTYLLCECWTKEISPPRDEELNHTIDSFLTFLSIISFSPLQALKCHLKKGQKNVSPHSDASWFPGSCLSFGWHRQAAQVRVVLGSPVW